MSATNPPDPNVNTFNNLYWITGDTALTQSQADKRYLRFPSAQGTENLQAINVNGVATFNQDATFNENIIVADGVENTTIFQDAVANSFLIRNNVNSGILQFQAKNSSGINSNLMTLSDATFNLGATTAGNINAGALSLDLNSTGLQSNKPITMDGTTANDRLINNCYYQFVDNSTLNYAAQIYASPNIMNYDIDGTSSEHRFAVNDAGGVQKVPFTINSTNTNISSSNGAVITTANGVSAQPALNLVDSVSGNTLHFVPNGGLGSYNPMSDNGNQVLVASGAKNTETLELTTWSDTASAVKIKSNSVVMGAGGTANTPTEQITIDGATTTTTTTGTNLSVQNTNVSFTSTTPPTSNQTIPAANDSSTKIPTTAWVQSAISAAPAPPIPADITPNSITITPTTSPPQLATGVKNYYNEGALIAVDAFVPYNASGSKQVRQYFARLVFNPSRNLGGGGNNTIYQSSQVRVVLTLTANTNVAYWGSTYGISTWYYDATFMLNYNYQQNYGINMNTDSNSSQGFSIVLSNSGSNNSGGWNGINPKIWVEKVAGQNWYNFYWLNGPFSAGGTGGSVAQFGASFTIELLNGGQSVDNTSSVWLEEYIVAVNV